MDAWLRAMLTETVSHQAYLGQDGYGASQYGLAVERPCRIEAKVQPIPTAQGEERTSMTRIFFAPDFPLELRDRIVLPDETAPQIQRVTLSHDEFGVPHHQTAWL